MSIADETADRLRATSNDVRGALAARTVFGEPVTAAGMTVVPAARVRGGFGGGGGGGAKEAKEGSGVGLGYGISARPVGAFVIDEDGGVRWKPALDPVRMFVVGCVVAIAYFIFARSS
ncbi:MAG: spore germination protein GerW family protein [Ilumatobacteraceae bacterium]